MLSEKEMEEIATDYITQIAKETNLDIILFHKHTRRMSYGNLYVYNSRKFIEELDYNYALLGNAPFLIEKETGKIFEFGTSETIDYYLGEYEAGRWQS